MPSFSTITIDLSSPPNLRWSGIFSWKERIGRLLAAAGGPSMQALAQQEDVMQVLRGVIPHDYLAEIDALATATRIDGRALMLGNATYDLVKFGIGCSAVAVDTPDGPLHGRNLDWYAPDNALARETIVCRFINAPAGEFASVGWPGFLGVLSGIAPGRFSITLNAAFSNDPPVPRQPVAFLLRRIFEEERDFASAVSRLAREQFSTDCLILIAGVRAGEMVVIERTPSRHVIRQANAGAIRVTNDFIALAADVSKPLESEIHQTSCFRFERLGRLLSQGFSASRESMGRILSDAQVQMPITVQRMVFCAATGLCDVEPVIQQAEG